ncbi:FAD-linked reductase [Imleria badia]|nr:FAD-linked reductase [Imleria badia]
MTLDWLAWNQTYFNEQKELYDASQTGAFSDMTLTPLQAAQYNLTLQMADSGVPFVAFTYLSRGDVASTTQPNEGYVTMVVWNLHELSRGSVHINSSNPQASPVIDPQYMAFEWDLSVLASATQFFDNMVASEPFASQIQARNTPNSMVQTVSQWSEFVLETVQSTNYLIGTTPMAAQNLGGVVDSRLRVYGLTSVCVVDAGVIPLTIGGPPQQTVYTIAEKVWRHT